MRKRSKAVSESAFRVSRSSERQGQNTWFLRTTLYDGQFIAVPLEIGIPWPKTTGRFADIVISMDQYLERQFT